MSTFLRSSVKFLLAPDKFWSKEIEYTLKIVVWSVIVRRWDYCDKEEYQRKRCQVVRQYCQLRPIHSLVTQSGVTVLFVLLQCSLLSNNPPQNDQERERDICF
jgi:hypothetical protein